MAHYETEYSGADTFDDRRDLNNQKIKELLMPHLTEYGCMVDSSNLDMAPLVIGHRDLQTWIDPSKRSGKDIRPPDIQPHHSGFNIQGAEGLKSILVEVKDFPQMNKTLSTGFKFPQVRTYLAVQHHYQMPVVLLFRDNRIQEIGERPGKMALPPFESAFKEGDKYFWYGDLLVDMELHEESCFLRCFNSRTDTQIRWVAQRGRGFQDNGLPVMKPLHSIMDMLLSGRIKKVVGDADELPLWRFIQQESRRQGYPQMEKPKDGLVYFTSA